MPTVEVERVDTGEPSSFGVRVTDDDGSSAAFQVSLSRSDRERLAGGYPSDEAFIRACFGFLLEREPMGSIMPSFDVSVISTYFPGFEREIVGPTG